jgi:hypothetical protein
MWGRFVAGVKRPSGVSSFVDGEALACLVSFCSFCSFWSFWPDAQNRIGLAKVDGFEGLLNVKGRLFGCVFVVLLER